MEEKNRDNASERLLPCPFCGSSAEIKEKIKSRGTNKSGIIPDGAMLVMRRTIIGSNPGMPKKTIYHWEKKGYTPHCFGTKCICRTITVVYDSQEEAVEAWNKRTKPLKIINDEVPLDLPEVYPGKMVVYGNENKSIIP